MLTIFVLLPIGNLLWLSRPSTLKPYLACIRKCGENPRPAGQIPDLRPCDLRFNWQKSGCVQQVSIFPALPKYAVKNPLPRSKFGQVSFGNSPPKRENRLSAVPTDQAERIVARPHHAYYFKGELARPSIQYRQALESYFEPHHGSAIHQGNRIGAVVAGKFHTDTLLCQQAICPDRQ